MDINLVYFPGYNNFGDHLSKFIVQSLINSKYNLSFNKNNIKTNLLAIGSIIHFSKDDYYIYGTGIRSFPIIEKYNFFTKLNIISVRGKLSRDVLINHFKKIWRSC
jgi:pyruvyltransferase